MMVSNKVFYGNFHFFLQEFFIAFLFFMKPESIDEYVHRIGRTGRVGNTGKVVHFALYLTFI